MRQLKISKSITNRESQSITLYLQEVNRVDLISHEEEERLSLLIKKGDKKAFERLVNANLRFVVSVAKQYQYQGLSLSDLISEGNIGLMQAARSFDTTRGFKFISYAVWSIRQHIVKSLADDSRVIRVPINKVNLAGQIKKAGIILEQKLERTATIEELAEEMNMKEENIRESMTVNERHCSLDATFTEDGEESMMDVLKNPNADNSDEKLVSADSLNIEIERILQILSDIQRKTICYFFGIGTGDEPMSLDEIGDKFCLTRERIRQIKNKAIEILRATPSFHLLRSYLAA